MSTEQDILEQAIKAISPSAGITIASWQAFVTQLVPKESMLSAVRLNGMQFTGARAFGPAETAKG